MEKMTFEDFLKGIDPFVESFVVPMHNELSKKGYAVEVKPAAQGPVVSYKTPKTKRTLLNYVFRKSGMQIKIYGDNAHCYQTFFDTLPSSMEQLIEKATDCRLCNSRCPKGYCLTIKGNNYNKCRYGAFLFPLSPETVPHINVFIENEVNARSN